MSKEERDVITAYIERHSVDVLLKAILEICKERNEFWGVMNMVAVDQITIRS